MGKNLKESLKLSEILMPTGLAKYRVGQLYGNKSFVLKEMSLKHLIFENKEKTVGNLTLELHFERSKNSFGGRAILKQINMLFTFDHAQNIIACGAMDQLKLTPVSPNIQNIPISTDLPNALELKKIQDHINQLKEVNTLMQDELSAE